MSNDKIKAAYDSAYQPHNDATWYPFKDGFNAALAQQASEQTNDPSTAAIEFTLKTDEGLEFLRCWLYGDFEAIRREWPEAPESVFIGADPLYKEESK